MHNKKELNWTTHFHPLKVMSWCLRFGHIVYLIERVNVLLHIHCIACPDPLKCIYGQEKGFIQRFPEINLFSISYKARQNL